VRGSLGVEEEGEMGKGTPTPDTSKQPDTSR